MIEHLGPGAWRQRHFAPLEARGRESDTDTSMAKGLLTHDDVLGAMAWNASLEG